MKHYNIFLLLVFLFYSFSTSAQSKKQVYLLPHIGVEWVLSGIEDKSLQPPYVVGTSPYSSDKYGLDLMMELSPKWSIFLGYGWGNIGDGLRYKSQTDSASFPISGGSSTAAQIRRVYASVARKITTVQLFRRKSTHWMENNDSNDKVNYRFNFNFGIQAGISYEHFARFTDSRSTLTVSSPFNDRIILQDGYPLDNPVRWRGMGVFSKVYFQFYNKYEQKRLRLSLIYHQGIQKRMFTTWQTSINGTVLPDFQTFTRGSMFAVSLSYPIKLFALPFPKKSE